MSSLLLYKRGSMRICHVTDDYIAYLHQYDAKVLFNKTETRPYVGVLINIGGMKYYAPLSSPKPKHRSMKNSKDFRRIAGGRYGAINFNNMIPVPDCSVVWFDFANEPDPQYKGLLIRQYQAIKQDAKAIKKTAEELRNLLLKDDTLLTDLEKSIKARCCDLTKLEQACTEYENKVKAS